MELVANLAKAQADGRLEERDKPKRLMVDELGDLPPAPDAAHLLFQLASHAGRAEARPRRAGG